MQKKTHQSLYFKDCTGSDRFLFSVLTYYINRAPQLKFIFSSQADGVGTVYSPNSSFTSPDDVISMESHISYHADGNVRIKAPGVRASIEPSRMTPLADIRDWEKLAQGVIVDYGLARKNKPANCVYLPENSQLFDGSPVQFQIYLGHPNCPEPTAPDGILFRLPAVTHNVDLMVFVFKSNYQGRVLTIPGTNISFVNRGNVVQLVKPCL